MSQASYIGKGERAVVTDSRSSQTSLEPIAPHLLRSARDHVYDALRNSILSGTFAPHERLNERKLASDLAVSTTPLKEALRRLEAEGLLTTLPRRGIYIAFDETCAEEMTLARAAFESLIARYAAQRCTPEDKERLSALVEQMREATNDKNVERLIELNAAFHHAIHVASRTTYLPRLLEGQSIYDRNTRIGLLSAEDEQRAALTEHTAIYKKIVAKKADEAERLMRSHIIRSGRRYISEVFRSETKKAQK